MAMKYLPVVFDVVGFGLIVAGTWFLFGVGWALLTAGAALIAAGVRFGD